MTGEFTVSGTILKLFVSDEFTDDLDATLGKHNIDKLADYGYNNP